MIQEEASQRHDEDTIPAKTIIFSCKRCRQKLFEESDLESHVPSAQKLPRRKLGQAPLVKGGLGDGCTSLFLQHLESASSSLEWLGPMTETEGKLHCPNKTCGSRIGSYSWTGSQCSCGTWVVPAIQVPMSKVDRRASNGGSVVPVVPVFHPGVIVASGGGGGEAEEDAMAEAAAMASSASPSPSPQEGKEEEEEQQAVDGALT